MLAWPKVLTLVHPKHKGIKAVLHQTSPSQWQGLLAVDALQSVGTHTLCVAGHPKLCQPVVVSGGHFGRQNIVVGKAQKQALLHPTPGELERIAQSKQRQSPQWWGGALPWQAPVSQCTNSPFGTQRFYNGVFSGNYHKGVDHRSAAGTPIYPTAAGEVVLAKQYAMHGGTVMVDHGWGVVSIYIHQQKLNVVEGQRVERASVLGWVGSTGFATGPHLHWGLSVHGLTVNPKAFVPALSPC